MAKQRIEYIDAMRGFTMILVVYSHICHLYLGDSFGVQCHIPWMVILLITVFFVIASTNHPASDIREYLRFNLGSWRKPSIIHLQKYILSMI